MAKTIIGIFPNLASADSAADALMHYGYRNDEVSIISKESGEFEYKHPEMDLDSKSRFTGLVTGMLTGAVIGILAGFTAFYIPGLNISRFPGALGLDGIAGTIIVGALIGVFGGGLIGFLSIGRRVQYGRFSYDEIERYGQVLVAVPSSDNEETEIRGILNEYGAERLQTIDLNEYVEEELRARYEPVRMAGVKGGRRNIRNKISDKL